MLIQIDLPYACFGIVVRHGKVIDAAPIGNWMVGKLWKDIKPWIAKKNGKYECTQGGLDGQEI